MTDARVIEVMLLRWGDSSTAGRTVTFQLPDGDGSEHPFRHLKCGKNDGQRLALSVAVIADDETVEPESDKRSWEELPPAQQAGIRCNEPSFRKFLTEMQGRGDGPVSETEAAQVVRDVCCVRSRSEIRPHSPPAKLWNALESEYQTWMSCP